MERALLISVRTTLALVLLTPLVVMTRQLPFSWFPEAWWLLPKTFFPFIVGKAIYAHVLTEIALGLWVLLAIRYPSHRAPRSWLLLIFGAYVLVVFASSLLGVSPQRSLWSTYERMQGFVDVVHWLAFAWVAASVFRSWSDWRFFLNLNLGIAFVFGLLGVATNFGIAVMPFLQSQGRLDITLGNPTYVGAYMLVNVLVALAFLGHSLLGPPAVEDVEPQRRRRRRGRPAVRSQVFSPTAWALGWLSLIALAAVLMQVSQETVAFTNLVVVMAAFGASYFISARQRETWWRVFWVTAIFLYLYILNLSGTRGAVIGLSGGVLTATFVYAIWGRLVVLKWVALAMIANFVVLVLVIGFLRDTAPIRGLASSSVMLSRIFETGRNDASLTGRINSARVGLRSVASRPILGWGPENFTIAYDRHVTADMVAAGARTSFDQAHNKLIEELTTKGILGFAGYAAIWVYMAWVVVQRVRQQDSRLQLHTLLIGAGLAGYFVQNLFLFDTPGTVVWFVVLLSYVVYLETSPEAGPALVAQRTSGVPSGSAGGGPRDRPATRRRPAGGSPVFQSDGPYAGAFLAVGILVVLAVLFVNVRTYQGARTVLGTLDGSISWGDRIGIFEESIEAFPALGNYPRIAMFNQVARSFAGLSEQDRLLALEAVDKAGKDALDAEPEEWRIHVALASVYQQAGSSAGGYTELARLLVDEAARLAPERLETVGIRVQQFMMEMDYDGAYAVMDNYVEKSPEAAVFLEGLRRAVDAAASR